MHAAWADDFHHALHAVLSGERAGYYADFGELSQVADALEARGTSSAASTRDIASGTTAEHRGACRDGALSAAPRTTIRSAIGRVANGRQP